MQALSLTLIHKFYDQNWTLDPCFLVPNLKPLSRASRPKPQALQSKNLIPESTTWRNTLSRRAPCRRCRSDWRQGQTRAPKTHIMDFKQLLGPIYTPVPLVWLLWAESEHVTVFKFVLFAHRLSNDWRQIKLIACI